MVEILHDEKGYETGFRAGKLQQLKSDISLIQEIASEACNFEDFKLRLRDQLKKIDRKTWF